MAFFIIVIMKGNTWKLMTSTRPASEKNQSVRNASDGNSCCMRPLFCMKRIHPIDAIYGGVMNGIMKIMSKKPYCANDVLEKM